MDEPLETPKRYLTIRAVSTVIVVCLITTLTVFVIPPASFVPGTVVEVPQGSTLEETAALLEARGVIRSSFAYSLVLHLRYGGDAVKAGVYLFEKPLSVFSVAERTANGTLGTSSLRVTIPEGKTVREIGLILEQALPSFDREAFVAYATPFEGYLFPETYFFPAYATPELIVQTMRNEFETRFSTLREEVDVFGVSKEAVVTMASLLEKEARLYETKQVVAGILWKRIEIGMPLQVDAVFGYIFGTDTFSPTFDQLEIDSPYNTYLNRGLPPGPIANPGLESLRAAVNPVETPYLYYLTGVDGRMHYGRTFEEHVANRRFLR